MSRLSNIVASFFAQAKMDDKAILDVVCGTGTFDIVYLQPFGGPKSHS